MSRIRTIKPEFWTSEQVVECSPIARLLFVGIWNFCDDFGNHPLSIKALKMRIFPGDDFTLEQMQELFNELVKNGLVALYSHGEAKFFHVVGWYHQKIDRPTQKFPQPTEFDEPSTSPRRAIEEPSPPEGIQIQKGCSQENSANSPASPESSPKKATDEKLIAVCAEWNNWYSAGIVRSKIQNPNAPGKTIADAWTRAQRDKEQRNRLKDLPALREAIAASQVYLKPSTWFDAAGLIGGRNSNRRWYCEQLLNGTYRDKPTSAKASAGTASNSDEAETEWARLLKGLLKFDLQTQRDKLKSFVGQRVWTAATNVTWSRICNRDQFTESKVRGDFLTAWRAQ